MSGRRGWWRRNRWALAALPVALVAALAASSDRVASYYWHAGLHDARTAGHGEWLELHDEYTDAQGTHERVVRVRLDRTAALTPAALRQAGVEVPRGARAVQVTLSLEADPDLPLALCRLALRDADGTRYDYEGPDAGEVTTARPISPCVPGDTPGPSESVGRLDALLSADERDPRPRSWTVEPVVVVPDDARVDEVLLWWREPVYVALDVG
ncbi:hypothetical protein [Cellulomonas cellasea]|uniref:Uncharacterized protein n=1 Tax=Cellulomonas cellasea TaxID=43670 RepID=A0A7W4UBG2_9CELL|nr:hypothetical protein [Cellulomonas cellasea]MBB2921135.1 hypothetical protein [Cellulomonas cellasea]